MTALTLRADCARCAALCCVALAFDRSDLFAFDKDAGQPCAHLDGRGACRIHAARDRLGMGGCLAFDCHGAGQHVTQTMFGGRSWQDDPALLGPMIEAFSRRLAIHRQLALLQEARRLPLPRAARRELRAIERRLATANRRCDDPLIEEAQAFLRSLQPYARRRSFRISRAELWPGAPVTPPPGCVPEPQR